MQTNNQAFCCLRLLAVLLWTCLSPLHPTCWQWFDTDVTCFALFNLLLGRWSEKSQIGSLDDFLIKDINYVYSLIMQRITLRPTSDVLSITRHSEEPAGWSRLLHWFARWDLRSKCQCVLLQGWCRACLKKSASYQIGVYQEDISCQNSTAL